MKFILENYMLIIIVGLFFVFALIGYLVDLLRNNKNNNVDEIVPDIKPIDIKKIDDKENKVNDQNDKDDLLTNYNQNNM